jgi:lipopolysaccharide export system permease protein
MIFRRALLQELTVNTVGVFVVLMAIISTQIIIRLLGQAASGALPADGVMGILAFTALTQLPRLLAATLFTSVLLTLSRSWRDSEMVIWMSSGQSLLSWIRPVLQFAFPLAFLAGILSIGLSPWAVKNRIEYQSLLESRDELVAISPGMFQERRKDGSIHFIESLNPINGEINRIFRHSDDKNIDDTVIAKSGFIYTDPKGEKFLILENGRRYQGTAGTNLYETVDFKRYGLRVEQGTAKTMANHESTRSTLTLLSEATPRAGAELFWRFSWPLVTLILVYAAIPLSFVNPRMGRSYNIILGIMVFAVYFQVTNITQAQIQLGRVHYLLALLVLHGTALALVMGLFYKRYQGASFWQGFKFWHWPKPKVNA